MACTATFWNQVAAGNRALWPVMIIVIPAAVFLISTFTRAPLFIGCIRPGRADPNLEGRQVEAGSQAHKIVTG